MTDALIRLNSKLTDAVQALETALVGGELSTSYRLPAAMFAVMVEVFDALVMGWIEDTLSDSESKVLLEELDKAVKLRVIVMRQWPRLSAAAHQSLADTRRTTQDETGQWEQERANPEISQRFPE